MQGLVFTIACCVWPVARSQTPEVLNMSNIDEITLERDCSGCPTGSRLVLRRDGLARLTTTGKARLGTQDSSRVGRVRLEDFDELARLAVALGYFDMREVYDDPETQDGAWANIGVERGGQHRQVFCRDGAEPPALRAFTTALEAVQAKIAFALETR